jgi:CheY-like chemotaxis protein
MDPKVRIIAASGLTPAHDVSEATLEGVRVFLTKPYTAEKLLKALAKVLVDG